MPFLRCNCPTMGSRGRSARLAPARHARSRPRREPPSRKHRGPLWFRAAPEEQHGARATLYSSAPFSMISRPSTDAILSGDPPANAQSDSPIATGSCTPNVSTRARSRVGVRVSKPRRSGGLRAVTAKTPPVLHPAGSSGHGASRPSGLLTHSAIVVVVGLLVVVEPLVG